MRITKRAVDIVVGTVLLIAAVPILFVASIWLLLSFGHFPFFMQKRIGYQGALLRFPKLRTLPSSTPSYALKTDLSFDELPRAGKVARNLHVDELPQLALVVAGKLSLVGPRPKMPDDVEPCDAEYGRVRVTVPQGCTGLWQVSVAKAQMPDTSPEYDLFYVAHRSNRFDLWILWRTLLHGLRLGKLITLSDIPAWVCPGEECAATWHASPVVRAGRPTVPLVDVDLGDVDAIPAPAH